MKKIITVGTHSVEVEILPSPNGAIAFWARCGKIEKKGMINPTQAKHDHTEEQYRKDIDEFASRLAIECAGHAQSLILSKSVFGDLQDEKDSSATGVVVPNPPK